MKLLCIFSRNTKIGIYFGEQRLNNVKTDRITELGIVSGDTLFVRVETDDLPESSKAQCVQNEEATIPAFNIEDMQVEDDLSDLPIQLDCVVDLFHGQMHRLGYEVRFC
jgi:hypothetical protein